MLKHAKQISKSLHYIRLCTNKQGYKGSRLNLKGIIHNVQAKNLDKGHMGTQVKTSMLQKWNRTFSVIQNKLNDEYNTRKNSLCTALDLRVLSRLSPASQEQNTKKGVKYNPSTFLLSSVAAVEASNFPQITEPIPEPPPVPPTLPDVTDISEAVNQLNALGEPTFASLGLGGLTPVGFVQDCFEYLHVTLDLPWWGAIAIGTLVIRLLMFPLVVIAQRNAAKMNNYLPQLQALQVKMTEARQMGNQLEAARYTQELALFMKEKQLNPLKNMIVPLAQMPVFLSFFMSLREMANLPIDSMRTGGLWWFTDLTVPDQFYLMPIITSLTLLATIELGADTGRMTSSTAQTMRYVLRALPVVIFPFIMNFPGAILCYWVSSNFISLVQVGILKIPSVREYFKIEQMVKFDPQNLPIKPKPFTQNVQDTWTNLKISRELEERKRLDEMIFQKAGKGPLVKTFKYDPTKIGSSGSAAPMSAKKG